MSIHCVPMLPPWLLAVLSLALLLLVVHGSVTLWRKHLPAKAVLTLLLLRLLGAAALILCALMPIVSIDRNVPAKPDLVVLVDVSASMEHKTLDADRLIDTLSDRFRVAAYDFDTRARLRGSPTSLGVQAQSTDLASALDSALDQVPLDAPDSAGAPRRVLLLSDGIDHGVRDPLELALSRGVRVDVCAPQPAVDMPAAPPRFTHLQAPQRVRLGGVLRVLTTIAAVPRHSEQRWTLELLEDDKPVRQMTAMLGPGVAAATVAIDHQPSQSGMFHYALRLRPAAQNTDAPPPILARSASLPVHVGTDRLDVLMLESSWRWSFRFTRRAIEDDPSLNLTAFLHRGERSWMQFVEPGGASQSGGLPQTYSELACYDVFVLGNLDPRHVPADLLAGMQRLVTDEGRALVVVAGPNLARLAAAPQWSMLLPVEFEGRPSVQGPVGLRVSEPQAAAFFGPGADGVNWWSQLPPLPRLFAPLRKKPGATVLGEASDLSNEYGPLIALAWHRVGRGRCVFIGSDALWQWQMLGPMTQGGLTPYGAFWQQLLRAVAPVRGAADSGLELVPHRTVVAAGRQVELEVRPSRDDARGALTGAALLADGTTVPLQLIPDARQPGHLVAAFDAAVPGPCLVRIGSGEDDAGAQAVIDIAAHEDEAWDQGVDAVLLDRLARDSGGQWVDPSDASTWPQPDAAVQSSVRRLEHFDLWHSGTLLVLVAVLFGIDWLIRTLGGYV